MPPDETLFDIGAPGVDTERIVADLRERVQRRTEEGAYADALVARAERSALVTMQRDADFLRRYLASLREAVYVDINDFEIRERRSVGGFALKGLKRTIWKLLKFYTYRLWSQQNEVNGLLVSAIEGLQEEQDRRLSRLEKALERAGIATGEDQPPADE